MRLLHTSDWHLGLSTGPVPRAEEQGRFLAWLGALIVAREVDALIVAGDVFDTAQPSAEALRLYYGFLAGLRDTGVGTVVIVGGNHDSQARLEAPRELLGALDVRVVGGMPSPEVGLEGMVVPLRCRDGRTGAVCVALPYVHEYRLGIRTAELDQAAMAGAFRARFTALYTELADLAEARYPGRPIVATGHLTLGEGHTRDDYPQEIHQVGSIDALPASILDPRLRYVALGHIHRCYAVAGGRAWYSGSPVATSVSERQPARRVLLVDLPEGAEASEAAPRVERVEVPTWRALHQLEGELDEVLATLATLAGAPTVEEGPPLPPLVFVRVTTDTLIPELRSRLQDAAAAAPEARRPVLVEIRELRRQAAGAPSTPALPALDELSEIEVFRHLCAAAGEGDPASLEPLFASLASAPPEEIEARIEAISRGEEAEA